MFRLQLCQAPNKANIYSEQNIQEMDACGPTAWPRLPNEHRAEQTYCTTHTHTNDTSQPLDDKHSQQTPATQSLLYSSYDTLYKVTPPSANIPTKIVDSPFSH